MTDDPLLIQTAQTIVNRMLSESAWFNICDVAKAAELLGVSRNSPEYQALQKYHYVEWRDMPGELRARVLAELAQAFGAYAPRIVLSAGAARAMPARAWPAHAQPVAAEPERPTRFLARIFRS